MHTIILFLFLQFLWDHLTPQFPYTSSPGPMSSILKQLIQIAKYMISYTVENKALIQEWQNVFILITGYKTTQTQKFKQIFSINTRNTTLATKALTNDKAVGTHIS